jgi:hypothetical protein
MTAKILISLFLVTAIGRPAVPVTGKDIVLKMYNRYSGKWYQTYTFNQTTEFYRNDSLKGTQTWYEAVKFPGKFRIDFGEADSGNAVIFNADSSYNFKNGKLKSTRKNDDDLSFLLGGMYFYTPDQVLFKLKGLGYDLGRFHVDIWEGKPVFVIGAAKGDTTINQLWIDQKDLYLVRMLKFDGGRKEEGIFGEQKAFGGGWSETKCRFYFNDKLVQVETYHDCKVNVPIADAFFDPMVFSMRH